MHTPRFGNSDSCHQLISTDIASQAALCDLGTDVNCGGSCPNACEDGKRCNENRDCKSFLCGSGGTCQVNCVLWVFGRLFGSESACGKPNIYGLLVQSKGNHMPELSLRYIGVPASTQCTTGSGFNCGGTCPQRCPIGSTCVTGSDCISVTTCTSGICSVRTLAYNKVMIVFPSLEFH